ncbi:MAG: MBL fold metallo-hydrolase [bacterium]
MLTKNNHHLAIIELLVIVNILGWIAVYDLSRPSALKVEFFDIGQGDAILIITPLRHKILIDGGPDNAILEKLNTAMPFWDRRLDAIILTHPDHDHMGGLIEVIKNYNVGNVIMPETNKSNEEIKEWQSALKTEQANVRYGVSGNKLISGNVYLNIIHPKVKTITNSKKTSVNEDAIVARLSFDKISYLFTSDINGGTEKEIIKAGYNLKSSILKIPHHGSASSTTDAFLKSVSPSVAIISVGENNYGHPSEAVFKRMANYDIKILRTDISGDITTISNGEKIKITSEK